MKSGQKEFFSGEMMHNPEYYNSLRDRYLAKSKESVLKALQSKGRIIYDEAWEIALSKPLTWESDLKQWIQAWKDEGHLTVQGMKPNQRVPRRGESNYLVWK